MELYRCDKCNKEIDFVRCKQIITKGVSYNIKTDLCEDCYNKLEIWLENKE